MIDILSWLIVLPLSVSLAYLGIELLFGLRPLPPVSTNAHIEPTHIAILVPAHNEEAGISATVGALTAMVPGAHILVVADNCSDDTAAAARLAGAMVAERNDPERRGKGFALAFGREQLATMSLQSVIVVDADCRLSPGSAERLASRAHASGRPIQATNLLVTEGVASPLVAVSNFAMLVKNLVRARGLMRLGGGALLFGTGMAFPWPLFARLPLATGDTVEDLNLGLWLARQCIRVDLDDGSLVTSSSAPVESSHAQRSRWEHGFLRTAATQGLPMLLRGISAGSANRATLGAHLLVPPLALLMFLSLLALAIVAAAGAAAGNFVPLLVGLTAFGFSGAMLLIAWWLHGRSVLSFAALLRVPLYIVWKIPIYVGFFTRNQKDWNRTTREGDQN